MKVSNNTLGAWALLPESVTLLAHPTNTVLLKRFFDFKLARSPKLEKILQNFWNSITRVCGHTDTTSGVQSDRYIPWAATHLTIFNIRLGISAARIDQKFHGLTAIRAIDVHRYDQGRVTLVGVASGGSWLSMVVPFPI
tara:strand:+ start:324 stop:740 length:417 start_codon:yes stop_codon:yes gene_type:complete